MNQTPVASVNHRTMSADPMVPRRYHLVRRHVEVARDETAGIGEVVTLQLAPVEAPLAEPLPGQFAMVWAPGVGEVPISVSFLRDDLLGFTIRAGGATPASLCATPLGGILGLRGPFGRGWSIVEPTHPMVVVGGGIGLAPLRLLVESLIESRSDQADKQLRVVIGARSPAEILYAEDIDAWASKCEVHVTVDRSPMGWRGEVGLVTSTLARLHVREGSAAALCGPEIMMRLATGDLVAAGADPRRVEVSLERSMACAVAHCGRCQLGPVLLCRDGPVLDWSEASALMAVRRW